jgi:hypothetical protein
VPKQQAAQKGDTPRIGDFDKLRVPALGAGGSDSLLIAGGAARLVGFAHIGDSAMDVRIIDPESCVTLTADGYNHLLSFFAHDERTAGPV